MKEKLTYKGSRWYKCDLHLHTPISLCFKDKNVTAEEWVEAAIDKGLECVAVTDHNNGGFVDKIKVAAKEKNIIVFPAVEITCDSSKVHLLVIFDTMKSSDDIRDFLVRADIKASDFGKHETTTTKNIFDIVDLAKDDGGIVIPAHIDEYNGLGNISINNIKKFYSSDEINAVQVVNKEFLDESFCITDALKRKLNENYNNPTPSIEDTTIRNWNKPVKLAKENKLAILTFSDNPNEKNDSKHGIWGIGEKYTWIKMDENPSLEGLRQAFMSPNFRVKNMFESPNKPYNEPELWIKSLSVYNTTLTKEDEPLLVEFNPQLNTIIGGRGSGKSSILRFIRGVFNHTSELENLDEILKDHSEFYKRVSGRHSKGVMTESSIIEVEFVRNNEIHKIKASNIMNSNNQNIEIIKLNSEGRWENVTDEAYIDFFKFEHYSQKQIYEIAQEPNALRERIDESIDGLRNLKFRREEIRRSYLEKSATIRKIDLMIGEKGKLETQIKDIEHNIKKLQESGITDLLNKKEKFRIENDIIEQFQNEMHNKQNNIENLIQEFELEIVNLAEFDKMHSDELQKYLDRVRSSFSDIKFEMVNLKEKTEGVISEFDKSLENSMWKQAVVKNDNRFIEKKKELEEEGIDAILSFEKYTEEKKEIAKRLKQIIAKEYDREQEINERIHLQNEYFNISKEITQARQKFIRNVLTGNKVKINIKAFRNREEFEVRLRKYLQRENTVYQSDIDKLMKICFEGNVERNIIKFREIFIKIKNNEDFSGILGGQFINHIKSLHEAQIDEIELMLPEDEIEVQYKTSLNGSFKSLSTASAGQKTTAILTFILSYGNIPLVLDQPEDDLDNRLVYELVVDRLALAKEHRQIIVVTHNANIPVNGDAEYINSMDSESAQLKIFCSGTVERKLIKKEICDVMEGGESAFDMRSKRYKSLK